MRVQVNVDPTIGLQNYEIVRDVLAAHAPRLQSELVAFPQHGTLLTESQGLLTQALEAGVPILGGLDPASIDGDIEASLTTTFDLASRFDREVDIHLHDGGETGIYTVQRIIDYTREYRMAGRVAISHALALGFASDDQLAGLADGLATQGISVFTTQPISYASTFGARAVPWPILQAAGVRVCMINDNINDHWSPFGSGDLIERASRAAEIWRQVDEISLANAYTLVSDGVLPLDDAGEMLWPKVGDEASILFTNARCLSEVVARIPKQRQLMVRGELDQPATVARASSGGSGGMRTRE
jgi:cytosine/adenosine deaminase-related metal-dependent hydrolase